MAASLGRDRYARQSLGTLHARIKEVRKSPAHCRDQYTNDLVTRIDGRSWWYRL